MPQITHLRSRLFSAAIAALGLGTLLANHANAAVVTYLFDVNGTASGYGTMTGTYDWDATTNGGLWDATTAGTGPMTGWVQANFPKFAPTGTPTYTVTVTNNEQVTGIFASTAQVLTINAIGSGTLQAINTTAPTPQTSASADGFLGSSSADVTINAPISGAGAIEPSNGGNIRINGNNSYSGGTFLVSTSTQVHFGSDTAFGAGPINIAFAGLLPFEGSGGVTRTLANNFVNTVTGGGINFAADANTPVVSTGTWSLGANNLLLRNNGVSTSPLTLSNTISGTANITLSANNTGTIIFSGANLYSGTTTITGPGGTGAGSSTVRLKLGAANTIASSSRVILAGGILDPDGFDQDMGSTTLGVLTSTAISTIDFGVGASEVDFANSSAVAWTGAILNLTNWDPSIDKLEFGTDATGLTSAQLAKIEFNGAGLGTAVLDPAGYVVPEPASLSLLGLGAITLLGRKRRA